MRETLCIVLASILFLHPGLEAKAKVHSATSPAQAESKPTLKERVLEIPSGTMIEVRLLSKEKLRGRLGEVTDEGFAVQTAKGNKIETRKIAFQDVKSLSKAEGGKAGKTAGWIVLAALAGIGVLVLTMALIFAARSD
jgi:hypothetical protein